MGGTKCEKACHWNIAVVSIKWLTDIILGDLSALKLPVNLCYANVTGDESFSVDLNKVFHLLGTFTLGFETTFCDVGIHVVMVLKYCADILYYSGWNILIVELLSL